MSHRKTVCWPDQVKPSVKLCDYSGVLAPARGSSPSQLSGKCARAPAGERALFFFHFQKRFQNNAVSGIFFFYFAEARIEPVIQEAPIISFTLLTMISIHGEERIERCVRRFEILAWNKPLFRNQDECAA